MAKRKNMKVSSTADRIELAKLSKLISRNKTKDIQTYNMAVVEDTLEIGGSLKAAKRKLATGRDRINALRDEQGNITHNMDEIIKWQNDSTQDCMPATLNQGILLRVQANLAMRH